MHCMYPAMTRCELAIETFHIIWKHYRLQERTEGLKRALVPLKAGNTAPKVKAFLSKCAEAIKEFGSKSLLGGRSNAKDIAEASQELRQAISSWQYFEASSGTRNPLPRKFLSICYNFSAFISTWKSWNRTSDIFVWYVWSFSSFCSWYGFWRVTFSFILVQLDPLQALSFGLWHYNRFVILRFKVHCRHYLLAKFFVWIQELQTKIFVYSSSSSRMLLAVEDSECHLDIKQLRILGRMILVTGWQIWFVKSPCLALEESALYVSSEWLNEALLSLLDTAIK